METTSPAPGNVGVEGADLSKLADEKQDLWLDAQDGYGDRQAKYSTVLL